MGPEHHRHCQLRRAARESPAGGPSGPWGRLAGEHRADDDNSVTPRFVNIVLQFTARSDRHPDVSVCSTAYWMASRTSRTEICHRTWWAENTDGLRGVGGGGGSDAATYGSQHSRNAKAVVPVHVRYEDSALHMSLGLSGLWSLLANMLNSVGVQGGHAHGSRSQRAWR